MTNPKAMNSGRARLKDDDYKTFDPRCVWSFLEHFTPAGLCVDPCAPTGSGIVKTLQECGFEAAGMGNAFEPVILADWITSNPPYNRKVKIDNMPAVDAIIYRQVERIKQGQVKAVAMLMRWNFDFAISRRPMFADNRHYYGKIQMLFRPVWFERQLGDPNPFHPYVWHIWTNARRNFIPPALLYSDGVQP